jgi:hypothetical protein
MHNAAGSRTILPVILKFFAILAFMAAGIAGVLWVSLELAGAVSEGADGVWYIALGLAIAAVVSVVLVTARSRTRGMIGLSVAATVLLVAVVATYPTDSTACPPSSGQNTTSDPAVEGLEDEIQVDDPDATTDAAGSTDCK